MPGRGDNNKSGSAGRGGSNQSNQPFGSAEQKGKSNHKKNASGGKPSEQQERSQDQSANRNTSTGKDA
jgi:hypothetical protein